MTTRRAVLERLAVLSGTVGLAGCSRLLDPSAGEGVRGLAANPHADSLPETQFGQTDALRTDGDGNDIQPQYRRVLLLSLDAEPSNDAARTVERAMRTLEAAFEWAPDGLFHALAWGTDYFERIDAIEKSPIERPTVLSRTDDPDLQSYDAALVLSSDTASNLTRVENAMFGSSERLGDASVEHRLGAVFSVAGRRTGFMGAGLPREHADVEGVPADALSADDPMFTGFFSGRKRTQASEQRVRIDGGTFDGGTTMHLSHLTEDLDRWWTDFDAADRVTHMFSPDVTPEDVESFGTDVPFADAAREHAQEHGVVGHHEKVARARKDGEPLVLRRDFNTVDGGQAGVHFLSLQRDIADFRRTRRAMNGWYLRDENSQVTDRKNNGLLEFITVQSRANFYVPPRKGRAFPLL
ncbi:Dyp-type peroxidase [Halorussus salilacus]|uniref:Dyp-type peroxidase n=1 Tax=Halorussus salilacus TaxID=2953750 RepID=UPI0020A0165C|nr:Dyp-type peroxidase [Halorussus salilacus]USZ66901.1 Dyp-type peroxidase [Halorussus salilacus]